MELPAGWRLLSSQERPGREARFGDYAECFANAAVGRVLSKDGRRPYVHQTEALRLLAAGRNVCVGTPTASGKSLVFQARTLDLLVASKDARVLVLYPMRALAAEQERIWRRVLQDAGADPDLVARIDGGVPIPLRETLLRRSRILLTTPDIVHAWVLRNTAAPAVRALVAPCRLVIVDEVHGYSGVFGTNAAFMFRRLRYQFLARGREPQFLSASATMRDARAHVEALLGVSTEFVAPERDGSQRQPVTVHFVAPPAGADPHACLPALIDAVTAGGRRAIVFLDSRKGVDQLATLATRQVDSGEETAEEEPGAGADHGIVSFRAGYEVADREAIQEAIEAGRFRAIISTSALELGMDIPGLDVAILVGAPRSSTSLIQRIGRVGRTRPGEVFLVDTGSIHDRGIFAHPERLAGLPPTESSLYLENRRVQYLHALCLAMPGGEEAAAGRPAAAMPVAWPPGFLPLCELERAGQVPADLQALKQEAGDLPWNAFPLRDIERQFDVQTGSLRRPLQNLGTLSYSQLLREAYPGAVYRYRTSAFRVVSVHLPQRKVIVRRERQYFTTPVQVPEGLYPQAGAIDRVLVRGDLRALECSLQVRSMVTGFTERRGSKVTERCYPLDEPDLLVSYPHPAFRRTFFTTGVVLAHPALGGIGHQRTARMLLEGLLSLVAFDRQDLDCGASYARVAVGPIAADEPFLVLYDQTYGSLHLSSRLLDDDVLEAALVRAAALCRSSRDEECEALEPVFLDMAGSARQPPRAFAAEASAADDRFIRVIRPGSTGLSLLHDNQDFTVEHVRYNARLQSVVYEGTVPSFSGVLTLEARQVQAIPGESVLAAFDLEACALVESGTVN